MAKTMLQMANTTSSDVVYDLGSGEGDILITAAKEFGCRAVGYEAHGGVLFYFTTLYSPPSEEDQHLQKTR
jgi:hypothetical protein